MGNFCPSRGAVFCTSERQPLPIRGEESCTQLLELLAQLLDVVADEAVVDIHIRSVIEDIQRAVNIDFQGSCDALCLRLFLIAQNVVEVFQNTRGAISMARSNDYDSASSQFFIVHEDSTYLDGSYACFGYVTEGMDVVDAICADAGPSDNNGSIAAEEQPVIKSIVIQ